MPTYIILANLTDQAMKAIKIAPKRIDKAIKNFEEMGGKLIGPTQPWENMTMWPSVKLLVMRSP